MEGKDNAHVARAIDAAVEARAAQVGADILAQYRQLATSLRLKGWAEVAAMGDSPDPGECASRMCAFQLYGTAASELDDVITDLLDSLDRPFKETKRLRALRVVAGGKPDVPPRNGPRR